MLFINELIAPSFVLSFLNKDKFEIISFSKSSQVVFSEKLNKSDSETFNAVEILTRFSGEGKYRPRSIELILLISISTISASFSCVRLFNFLYF